MSKKYLDWNLEQPSFLPASPQDWLPVDHLAYHFRDVVSELDLRAIKNKKS